jgi:hypothetical protein
MTLRLDSSSGAGKVTVTGKLAVLFLLSYCLSGYWTAGRLSSIIGLRLKMSDNSLRVIDSRG